MKVFLVFLLVFILHHAECQNVGFEISTNGLDSIKIGMSKGEVEKVVKTSLQPYIGSTSIIKDPDSAITTWGCNNCTQKYVCRYKTVTLLLTFFRFTLYKHTDYELAAISPEPPSFLIHTKAGIKLGISEDRFIQICKNNKYPYDKMDLDSNKDGYLFSDRKNKHSAKTLIAKFSNKSLVDLMVINMIGD